MNRFHSSLNTRDDFHGPISNSWIIRPQRKQPFARIVLMTASLCNTSSHRDAPSNLDINVQVQRPDDVIVRQRPMDLGYAALAVRGGLLLLP